MTYPQFDYTLSSLAAAQRKEMLRNARIADAVRRKQFYPNEMPIPFIVLFKIEPVQLEARK
jgi:hypothetical protein